MDNELCIAMEADNTIRHTLKEEYILRDKYFPYVESLIPKTEHLLFRFIARYEDRYSSIINSPYPSKQLPFGINEKGPEYDIIYKCTGIDREELKADMKKCPLPGKLTKEKAAFLPSSVVLFFIIRYYLITKQHDKAKIIYAYYGYSIYWKRFHKSFKLGMNENVMIYTINEMSYRNKIKQLESLKELLVYIVQGRCEYYASGIAQACDEDVRYILDQIQSDIGSKMNQIASVYYKNYYDPKKKEIMMGDTMLDNEGTRREDTSNITAVEVYAQKCTNTFFSTGINKDRVRTAVNMAAKDIAMKEVINTLECIEKNYSASVIHEFYSAIFLYYLSLDDPRANVDSIKSMKFLALMKDVINKGNTTNKNARIIIDYVTKWLNEGSNSFRCTTRPGTISNYKKAVYYYFLLLVSAK